MHYVYVLQSRKDGSKYIGSTTDMKKRLTEHNAGKQQYTSAHIPYKLIWYAGFIEKSRTIQFERYLKQGSGAAFLKKHLLP